MSFKSANNFKRNWLKLTLLASIFCFAHTQPAKSQEVGQKLTPCLLSQLTNSKPLELNKFAGKVLYIDFWASWCPPCVKSFPFLNNLHNQYKAEGLQVIGINLDEVIEDAKQFAAKNPVEFILAADNTKSCAKDFGVLAMPTSYLIDRKGIVRYIHLGFRSGQVDDLHKRVKSLLQETTGSKPVI